MRRFASMAYAASALLLLASCVSDGTGRRQDENGGQKPSRYQENPDWTITYTGRSIDTSDGVYIVDDLHVASTSQDSYYLDVVSYSDFESAYSSEIGNFIESSYDNMDAQYVVSGDSDASYDRLADEEWIAVAYEILDDGSLGDEYAFLKFTPTDFNMTKDDTYAISVKSRQTDSNGDVFDEIDVATDSPASYYVEVTYASYIDTYFNGDETSFFNYVLDNLAAGLDDDEDFSGLLCIGDSKTEFNRLRSGEWTAYAFGVDYSGYLTGNWSSYTFSLEEEEPSEPFKKWIGTWSIGDGNTSYDITVASSEANYYYLVSGWETGEQASDYANQNASGYQFETAFYDGKDMDFQTCYIDTGYDEGIGYYDVMLVGSIDILDSNSLPYCIVEEGIPIATAQLSVDGSSATVTALGVIADIDGTDMDATFVSMQYADLPYYSNDIYVYNGFDDEQAIPVLPMTMTKKSEDTQGEVSGLRSRVIPVRRGASAATKATSHDGRRRQALSGDSGTRRQGFQGTKAAGRNDNVRINTGRAR